MSFRIKTILLVVFLSLAPYVITMVMMSNVYRQDAEDRVRENLQYQLTVMARQLDMRIVALRNEMSFLASLDIMNDIYTGDLDRRITRLIRAKKEDLQLHGDIDVVGGDAKIIASSDISRVGTLLDGPASIEVAVHSELSEQPIGMLAVNYRITTLERFLPTVEGLTYQLTANLTVEPDTVDAITVSQVLDERNDFRLILSQEKHSAFAVLESFAQMLFVALVIGVIVIAIIAYLLANYIVSPILILSETAHAISETRDYSKRVNLNRSDEIGRLASVFNTVIEGMQGMILQLKNESANKLKLAQEKQRSDMLQGLSNKLAKYLSPQVYESIFSGERDVTLTSSRKKLTIFFSDIVGFTDASDQMESEDLTQLLNQYLSEMTDIALEYGATVDKYIGDAIMIFFGDPKTRGVQEDAALCIEMAMAMQKRVLELQDEWRSSGFSKPFSIRAGIHTGYCTVGNFGTENRLDYTIVGSAVNLASRIESSAEPGSVCISEDTFLLVQDRFQAVPIKKFTPRGLSGSVQLYRVLDAGEKLANVDVVEPGFELKVKPGDLTPDAKRRLKMKLQGVLKDMDD